MDCGRTVEPACIWLALSMCPLWQPPLCILGMLWDLLTLTTCLSSVVPGHNSYGPRHLAGASGGHPENLRTCIFLLGTRGGDIPAAQGFSLLVDWLYQCVVLSRPLSRLLMELWQASLAELPGSWLSAEAESMVANTYVSRTQPGWALNSWPDRLTFPAAFCVVCL